MRHFLMPVLIVLFLLGTWHPAEAVEPWKFYDNFQVGPIISDRWVGFGSGSEVREAARTIILDPLNPSERRLRLFDRSYGSYGETDAGRSFGGFALAFKNPSTITAIRATVQVRNFKSTGCPTNSAPTLVTADIFGNFFNAGTPIPGSRVDDVFAVVEMLRLSNSTDPPGVLRVDGAVIHCHNVDCSNTTLLGLAPLGTATTGQWVKLQMQWDQANHQFIFQRGIQPPVIVPYAVSDTAEPDFKLKDVEVIQFVANCSAGLRPVGMVDALFDNVSVNESAIP